MQRRQALSLIMAAITTTNARKLDASATSVTYDPAKTEWVAEALKRMQSIAPGDTRRTLLSVFTTEGGLSTGLHRTYVSQLCPYFKVDVNFKAAGRPDQDDDGRVTLVENER